MGHDLTLEEDCLEWNLDTKSKKSRSELKQKTKIKKILRNSCQLELDFSNSKISMRPLLAHLMTFFY